MLKIIEAELEKLKHRIDFIDAKIKSKFFKEKKKDEDLEEKTETTINDDGFEEARNLRKSGIF